MKTLFTVALFVCSTACFAQGTAKKETPVNNEHLDSISISIANQKDIDDLQKVVKEINEPDYVKKQTAILNDKIMTIVNALIKSKYKPEEIVDGSLQYEPGKLKLRIKK